MVRSDALAFEVGAQLAYGSTTADGQVCVHTYISSWTLGAHLSMAKKSVTAEDARSGNVIADVGKARIQV